MPLKPTEIEDAEVISEEPRQAIPRATPIPKPPAASRSTKVRRARPRSRATARAKGPALRRCPVCGEAVADTVISFGPIKAAICKRCANTGVKLVNIVGKLLG